MTIFDELYDPIVILNDPIVILNDPIVILNEVKDLYNNNYSADNYRNYETKENSIFDSCCNSLCYRLFDPDSRSEGIRKRQGRRVRQRRRDFDFCRNKLLVWPDDRFGRTRRRS